MSRTETIDILTRARRELTARAWCKGGAMRNRDGTHASRLPAAHALSLMGSVMLGAEQIGAPWGVDKGSADDAVRALQIAIMGESSQRRRAYLEVADANDAQPDDEGKAWALAKLTEAIGVVNSKKPRALRPVVDDGGEAA